MCEMIEPKPDVIGSSVLKTGTVFTAEDKLSTARYRMIGVDLARGGYIRLQNLDTNTEAIVEPEWFRQREISVQPAQQPSAQQIANILMRVFHLEGAQPETGEEISIRGPYVDLYLFAGALAMRIAAGDIELTECGDTCGKKAYYDKLLASIEKNI